MMKASKYATFAARGWQVKRSHWPMMVNTRREEWHPHGNLQSDVRSPGQVFSAVRLSKRGPLRFRTRSKAGRLCLEILHVVEKNGSSGRTRTPKPIRKSSPISNLLKTLSRTILRFRGFLLLRGNLEGFAEQYISASISLAGVVLNPSLPLAA